MLNNYFIKKTDPNKMDFLFQGIKRRSTNNAGDLGKVVQVNRAPLSRDGHMGVVWEGMLIVFGGDRHHMPFNDTFVFMLADAFAK